MGLIDRLKSSVKRLALIGLVGSSICLGGCESTNNNSRGNDDTALLGLGLMGLGVGRGNAGAVVVGRTMVDYAGQKESRDETNVNTNYYNGSSQINSATQSNFNYPKKGAFACSGSINYWNDFDNNHLVSYPAEFNGIRNKFLARDPIEFFAYEKQYNNFKFNCHFEIRDTDGNIVKVDKGNAEFWGIGHTPSDNVNFFKTRIEPDELKNGDYIGSWYVNGEHLGSVQFSIRD